MKAKRIALLALVGIVAFLSGGWLLQRGADQSGNVYQQARLFDDVLGYVSDYYVDSLGEARLYDMAIDGLLDQLNDPYSGFLRERDLAELTESTTGNYGGLGIRIDVRDGWITVIAPIAETPAAEAGLETGDRIIAVDGASTFGWKSDHAVEMLRGEPGSKVALTVARPGMPEPFDVTIARARIHVRAIQLATVLPPDVGYVSLVNAAVSEELTDELVQAITTLRAQGAHSLILDLRYNPGGLLDQGVDVSDLFLDSGEVVVTTRGRARGTTESYRARDGQRWPDMPIVVLVNGGTASAAEIIAGALQDHDRALVVGTPTFGKGLVQTVFRIGRSQALRLTTARWYTPSGRTIQRPQHEPGTQDLLVAEGEGAPEVVPDSTTPDSSAVYRTEAGRIVVGGGGIRPDLVTLPDTLTTAEQTFMRSLGAKLPDYRDVMTSYALELKGRNAVHDPAFRVSDAMRAELVRRLRERGVEVSEEAVAGSRHLLDDQFGYEVLRYVFGREAENQRRITDDIQIQMALGLLRSARTLPELFAAADRENGRKAQAKQGD